jgi:type II secretory pathway pseudopilin PulG
MTLPAFTLVEVLISLAIATIIVGVGLAQGLDWYARGISESDFQNVLSAIMRARAEAMNGICTGGDDVCTNAEPHGVYVTANEIVIFQGESYATRSRTLDEIFPLSGSTVINGSDEIVFEALSGDVAVPLTLQLVTRQLNETATRTEAIAVATDGHLTLLSQ